MPLKTGRAGDSVDLHCPVCARVCFSSGAAVSLVAHHGRVVCCSRSLYRWPHGLRMCTEMQRSLRRNRSPAYPLSGVPPAPCSVDIWGREVDVGSVVVCKIRIVKSQPLEPQNVAESRDRASER